MTERLDLAEDEPVHFVGMLSPKHVGGTLCGALGPFFGDLEKVTCEACWARIIGARRRRRLGR